MGGTQTEASEILLKQDEDEQLSHFIRLAKTIGKARQVRHTIALLRFALEAFGGRVDSLQHSCDHRLLGSDNLSFLNVVIGLDVPHDMRAQDDEADLEALHQSKIVEGKDLSDADYKGIHAVYRAVIQGDIPLPGTSQLGFNVSFVNEDELTGGDHPYGRSLVSERASSA